MAIPIHKPKSASEELKSGPPVEIWRVIFSYLGACDLCHCAIVSKEWNTLVDSIDSTHWKKLYLQTLKHKRWKHPFWPNETHVKPDSWKNSYRLRYLSSRLWLLNDIRPTCTIHIFKRGRNRRILSVGVGKPFHSIKAALDKANPYDEIYVYPALYQESTVLHIRSPVAIIGADDSSKIVLMMQIDMQAESAKLENLTIKPIYPRARGRRGNSVALVKALYGHLYIHNCTFEQGFIYVCYPGVADISSCTFDSAFLNMQGVTFSTVTNCKFTPERCAIFIEDPSYPCQVKPFIPQETGGWIAARNEKKFEEYYRENIKLTKMIDNKSSMMERKASSLITDLHEVSDSDSDCRTKTKSSSSMKSKLQELGSFKSLKSKDTDSTNECSCLDTKAKSLIQTIKGVIIRNILVSSGRGGITVCRLAQAWVENSTFCNLMYGIRCLNSSKCVIMKNVIHGCEMTGIFMRDHSHGLIAGNQIYSNGEAGIDIRSCADPIVQHNEIYGGRRSGIACLDSGKGLIRENDIHDNKEAGIYILHRGCPKVMDNFIWSGRAAGIAVTEHGSGHISHNIISGMEWAGIDIRHGSNPIISHNIIQNGHCDGIVVGEGGKSIIVDNFIEGNSGCGVWVLDGSHPLIHSNKIVNCGKSGIAFVHNSDTEHDCQTLTSELPTQTRAQNRDDVDGDEQSLTGDEEFMLPLIVPEIEPDSRFSYVSKAGENVAQVDRNTIEKNNGNGVFYDGKEKIIISRNNINNNLKHGVTLIHTSEITICENRISDNSLSGINVDVGVCCSIKGNGIYDNIEYGITTAGIGTVKDNDILSHGMPCICLRTCSDLSVITNRFYSGKHECIYLDERTRCHVENNTFYRPEYVKDTYKAAATCEIEYMSTNVSKVVAYMQEEFKKCTQLTWLVNELLLSEPKVLRPVLSKQVNEGDPYFNSAEQKVNSKVKNESAFCILF